MDNNFASPSPARYAAVLGLAAVLLGAAACQSPDKAPAAAAPPATPALPKQIHWRPWCYGPSS
ncbi:hypothetical protein BEN47_10695 [Hymenobacter lapidarius]|uniref:Uncharacterized protein n=1 Tax=Hymenobacter lapidarius TaxID=1908237 RepID=A0A1G1T965_9BACT|nr:hypothetical protein [Hymenobacter lapidarius]OGX87395.1 hypothetical protein BEN47_10695 [Hymenobacter lapidarius]